MLVNFFTPVFRQFLYSVMTAIRLQKQIGIYYDLSHLPSNEHEGMHTQLTDFYARFYNITFFSDFIPGFLTNKKSMRLPHKFNFLFIILLNYKSGNFRQKNLLNEIIISKFDYIIFSSDELDLVRIAPYLYLNLDLNSLMLLNLVNSYLVQFISLYLDVKKFNSIYDPKLRTPYNFNCFFLIVLMQNKSILLYYILKLKKQKNKKKTIKNLVTLLLMPTKFKYKFMKKYKKIKYFKILNKKQSILRKIFKKKIFNLFKKING